MPNNDKKKALYDSLTKDGYDLGDYDSFSTKINDEKNRKSLYNSLSKDNYDLGDYDSFNRKMQSTQSVQSTVQAPADQSNNTPVPTSVQAPASSYVEGTGKDTKVFGMPYEIFNNLKPESKQYYYEEEQRKRLESQAKEIKDKAKEQYNASLSNTIDKESQAAQNNPFLYAAMNSGMPGDRANDIISKAENAPDAQASKAAMSKAESTQEVIDASRRKAKGEDNIPTEMARGFLNKAKKMSTWDFGITDISESGALLSAAKKKENNQPLSPAEDTLLEGASVEAAANGAFDKDTSMSYRIGENTAQTASYGKDFALSGGLTGLGKAAVQKFGVEAAKKTIAQIAKNAALRVGGDLAGTTAMAASVHAGNTLSDTFDRMTGDAKYNVDKSGYASFDKTEGGESVGKALPKAFTNMVTQDFSELFGAYFGGIKKVVGKGIGAVADKVGLKNIHEAVAAIPASAWGKAYRDFADKTAYNGFIGEYGEELVGTALNAAFVGDNKFSDLIDPKIQKETFLSVAFVSGIMGGANIAGYRTPKYLAGKNLGNAEKNASMLVGNDWAELKDKIDNGDDKEQSKILNDYLGSEASKENKDAVTEYIARRQVYNGTNVADVKRRMEGEVPPEQLNAEDEYAVGMSLYTPEQRNEAKKALDNSAEGLSEDDLTALNGEDPLNYILNSESDTAPLLQYHNAKARYDGMIQNVRDDIDGKVQDSHREIDGRTASDGNIYDVTLKADDDVHYHIVKDAPTFNDDGTIDLSQSPEKLLVKDDFGKVQMIPARDVFKLTSSDNAEDLKDEMTNTITSQEAEKAANEIDGTTQEAAKPDPLDDVTIDDYIQANPNLSDYGKERAYDNEEETTQKAKDQASLALSYLNGEISPRQMLVGDAYGYNADASDARLDEEANRLAGYWANRFPQEITKTNKEQPKAETETTQKDINDTQNDSILPENKPENADIAPSKQSNVSETVPAEQKEDAFPLDKEGNVDYKQINDPVMYSNALKAEFGEEAPTIIGEEILNQQKQLKQAEKKGSAIEKARAKKRINAELSRLENIKSLLIPSAKQNEVPSDVKTDAEYADWVAENSDDANELATAHNAAKEQSSHENTLLPWQRELLGRKINAKSFNRFGDRNKINGTFAKAWLRKDGEGIDTLAQELSEFGNEVTEKDIVDFMLNNPTNYVRTTSDLQRKLAGRFSEVASKEMGFTIGSPDSNTGKLYLKYKKANEQIDAEKHNEEFVNASAKDTAPLYEQQTQSYLDFLDDKQMKALLSSKDEAEAAEYAEKLYDGLTADEIDEIYSQLNKKEDEQGEDSGDNDASKDGERPEGEQEQSRTTSPNAVNSEAERENSSNVDISSPPFVAPERNEGESVIDYADRVVKAKELSDQEKKVNPNPSEAQKVAGNYKMGHVKIGGYDVTIENPKGSKRKGIDKSGKPWSIKMNNTYGYFRGTKGKDGDHVDVFLGNNLNPEKVYVVDQVNPDGSFDEHKVMYGFNSEQEARDAYLANYEKGWTGLGNITSVSKEVFDKWMSTDTKKQKPFADYKVVQGDTVITTNQESNSNTPLFRETDKLQEIKDKAVADGSFMKAPNGKNTNLTERQWLQVRTPKFKEWFGDWENDPENASKIVDENGEPLVVYHGTDWDPLKEKNGDAVFSKHSSKERTHWFTQDIERASRYGEPIPVFINAKHPETETSSNEPSKWKGDAYVSRVENDPVLSKLAIKQIEKRGENPAEKLKEMPKKGDIFSLVVANANQIKSATENIGEFSINNDDIRFRDAANNLPEVSEGLVVLHNTSPDNLIKSARVGGFAMPSIAITKADNRFLNYGEISLIGDASMIDPKIKGNKVFGADAFSPRYPRIEYRIRDQKVITDASKKLSGRFKDAVENGLKLDIERDGDSNLANNDNVMTLFAISKGADIVQNYKSKYSKDIVDYVKGVNSYDFFDIRDNDKVKNNFSELYLNELGDKAKTFYEKRGYVKDGVLNDDIIRHAFNGIKEEIRNEGNVDGSATFENAKKYIEDNNLSSELQSYANDLYDKLNVDERIFKGYTKTGAPMYIPHTAENAVSQMKSDGLTGVEGLSGTMGRLRSKLTSEFKSLKAIKENENKITTQKDFRDGIAKASEEYYSLEDKLRPFFKFEGSDAWTLMADFENDVKDLISKGESQSFNKLSSELQDEIKQFAKDIVELPTEYFEAKPQRAISLTDFSAAVIPSDTDSRVKKILDDSNIPYREYSNQEERLSAVRKITSEMGLRFKDGAKEMSSNETSPIESEIISTSKKLNTPVRVITDVNEITDDNSSMQFRKKASKGWFDPSTGEVVIVLPNATSIEDARRTVLHEVVAHKGLRELFGADFDTFLDKVNALLPEEVRKDFKDQRVDTEEYIARLAESGETPSYFGKIKAFAKAMLRKAGINLKMTDNDLKYILWRSHKNLTRGNPVFDSAEDAVMRSNLFRDDETPKERISKVERLTNTITDLKNMIKESRDNMDSTRNAISAFIRTRLSPEVASDMTKTDIESLIREVNEAQTAKSLTAPMMAIEKTINDVIIRESIKDLYDLSKVKVQGKNNKGVSVAKKVDNDTRSLIEGIRSSFTDLIKSGLEKQIREKGKQISLIEKEMVNLEKDSDEYASLNDDLETLISERNALKEESSNLLNSKITETKDAIEKRISEIEDKYENPSEMSNDDKMELSALGVRSLFVDTRDIQNDISSIDREIEDVRRTNTELRKQRINNSDSEKKSINEQIKANLLKIESLKNDRLATQKDLIDKVNVAKDSMLDIIQTGKSKLQEFNLALMDRKKQLGSIAIEAVKDKRIDGKNEEKTRSERFKAATNGLKEMMLSPIKAPLMSFNFMLKYIDRHNFAGDGPLYKQFMKSDEGVSAAGDKYAVNAKAYKDELEKKAEELFGMSMPGILREQAQSYSDSGVYVSLMHNSHKFGLAGTKRQIVISKGQAMYAWMIWQMDDGRSKLENQGYDEETISEIEDFIGPEYIEYAKWVQDDFFPRLRDERYNETHKRMFGTSMASRDHYFPFHLTKESGQEKGEIGERTIGMPSLTTGNIVNRVRNKRDIDTERSAFDIMYDYGEKMEEWNAFAEVRRDLNGIVTNRYFRNLMEANEKGSHNQFKIACEVATRSFVEDSKSGPINNLLTKLNKSLAGGAIAFRLNTALKQLVSIPAFADYSSNPKFIASLAGNLLPIGLGSKGIRSQWVDNFKWCMDNLPSFNERILSGNMGNDKLADKSWAWVDNFIKKGMLPNRIIDTFSCSVGAKSVYDFSKQRYMKGGMSESEADNMAKYDASVAFNETQQSGRPEYMSAIQSSSNALWKSLTTFQNNNFGFFRKEAEAWHDLTLNIGPQARKLASMYMAEGLSRKEAEDKAWRYVWGKKGEAIKRFAIFGFGMPVLWTLAGTGILGWTGGGDDDNKDNDDLTVSLITGPIMGTIGIGAFANASMSGHNYQPMMVWDQLQKSYKGLKDAADNNGMFSKPMAIESLKRMLLTSGINYETFENITLGIEGAVKDGNFDIIDLMYVLNSPDSQRAKMASKIYKDMPATEYAEKVARAMKYLPADYWWVSRRKPLDKRRENAINKQWERWRMSPEARDEEDAKSDLKKQERKIKSNPDLNENEKAAAINALNK